MKNIFVFILIFSSSFGFLLGANILFVSAPGSASHRRSLYPVAEALATVGHSVTMFAEIYDQNDKAVGKNITNKNIYVNMSMGDQEDTMNTMLWKLPYFHPIMMIMPWWGSTSMTIELLKQQKHEFDELIQGNWDIIFVDALFTPTGVVATSLLKKPYVLFMTSAVGAPESLYRSIPYPASVIPAFFLQSFDYSPDNFWDRVSTTSSEISYAAAIFLIDNFIVKYQLRSTAPDISLVKFYNEADSPFVDYPLALDYPRPTTPDIIAIGGKCKSAILTDKELLDFVEDPTSKGTVILAFGHMVKWNAAPMEAKINLANALNELKEYRIIWQYKGESPVPMKSHVKLTGWLPQTELLNHPKTRVFVSHGGLKSVTEGICGQVPMVLIPFFAEQTRNAFLLKNAKAGEILGKHNLTKENIITVISRVAGDDNYKLRITNLKSAILDKPISAHENALFWTDFMIRHKGLPKQWFRVKGYTMNWIKYFCIDVLTVFTIAIIVTLISFVKIMKVIKRVLI